jgi:SAM-dependent methyltransferase
LPDAVFADPRLAEIYDPLDPDRSDLDVYLSIVDELSAHRVLDVGCGTGSFAILLAQRGIEVVGVDPAGASLDVARRKPGVDLVRFIEGDATTLPDLEVDLATMTGNVAQVFVQDNDWVSTLRAINSALRPGGYFVFETRDPDRRAWLEWTKGATYSLSDLPGIGAVEHWVEVTEEKLPLVSFTHHYIFGSGEIRTSDSTLRFRTREEIEHSLEETGFAIEEVRGAPDRPGKEFVFLAREEACD